MDRGTRVSRREFMRLAGGAALGAAALPWIDRIGWAADKRPNIIFILADDLGWGDLGCYGQREIKTPHLDKFAQGGIRFTNFYVCGSVCSPSRAAFTTGQFPAMVGIHDYLRHPLTEGQQAAGVQPFLDPKHPTLARILKGAGYATAHFGKWHLGSSPEAPTPSAYGYDVSRIVTGNGPRFEVPERDEFFRAKSTGLMVDEAIKFLEQNKDKPVYMNLWTLVPHATLNSTDEQETPYKHLRPGGAPDRGAKVVYYSSVTDLDAQLGRLFAKLDEMKIADNTIILFSSDNGPEDMHIGNASHSGIGSPGPFRGRKRSLYDGGIRVPFIVRWPGVTPPGKVDDMSVVAAVDLLPSLAAIAGAKIPAGTRLDGEDVGDILRGSGRQRKTTLYWEYRFGVAGDSIHHNPQLAIREGNWKLLCNPDGSRVELYDLSDHKSDVDNVADTHLDIARRLTEKLIAWQKTLPPGKVGATVGGNDYPWPK